MLHRTIYQTHSQQILNTDTQLTTSSCAIGLDIGGTKIAGGVVTQPAGQIFARQIIPTNPARGGDAVLADSLKLAKLLLTEASAQNFKVLGIGIGVAELVDLDGNITSQHTIAWRNRPIRTAFAQLAPATIESDVRAAALAEAVYGAGQPFRLFAYVTVGTGISCCLVQDRQPYPGARGNALVLASSPLTTTCPSCKTVLAPVLEDFASGPALVERYNRQSRRSVVQGQDVLAAVTVGDAVAVDVVKSAGHALGVSIGWLVNVLDPEAVIIGGGLGTAGGLYWDSLVASTRQHTWPDSSRTLPIIPAALGADAGLIGAAVTVFNQQISSTL